VDLHFLSENEGAMRRLGKTLHRSFWRQFARSRCGHAPTFIGPMNRRAGDSHRWSRTLSPICRASFIGVNSHAWLRW